MRYELNIGLDVAGGDNSPAARQARADKAVSLLNAYGNFNAQIIGDLDGADEPCLYVEGWFPSVHGKKSLEARVADISAKLGQDCIAIAYAKGGALAGPRAAAWGEFNPEYFRRPAVAVAA